MRPKTVAALNKVAEKANDAVEDIQIQDLSSTVDVQNMITTADTIVETVETSGTAFMELPNAAYAQTQTEGLKFRELQGLDKALQHTCGELVNSLAKLTDID